MILYITRHGQVMPASNEYIESVDFPKGDPPLTQLGRRQAGLLGLRLKEMGFQGQIYSSPYYRTVETAQIIAEIVDSSIIPSAPVREIVKTDESMVGFRGYTIEQHRKQFSKISPKAELVYPWWKEQAESAEDVLKRVGPFMDSLIEKGSDALVVAHGASTAAAVRHLLNRFGYSREKLPDDWNCNLTAVRISPDFEVLCMRDISHMPREMVSANAKMLLPADS